MKKKLKFLDELNIDNKSKAIVKDALKKWIDEFIKRADGRTGNVMKCDFKEADYFFFTDCKDIIGMETEEEGIGKKFRIRKRKRDVFLSLFLKQFIGDKIDFGNRKCTHCGFDPMDFEHMSGGFYKYCPRCERIIMDTYIPYLRQDILFIIKEFGVKNGEEGKAEKEGSKGR